MSFDMHAELCNQHSLSFKAPSMPFKLTHTLSSSAS